MAANPKIAIPFLKASACGNDFLLVSGAAVPAGTGCEELTRKLCDRHEGLGADGVEWLYDDDQCDIRIRLINADGSPAEISGNGTRCVAAHLVAQTGKERVEIRTDAGVKTCTLKRRNGNTFEFETAMGEPLVGDPFAIKLAFREVTGVPVSMGNPHFVLFVDEFLPGWQAEAAEIGRHHDFQHGINVELVKVESQNVIEALFFERGAGETQSSGTGSCAAAVAAIFTGKAKSPVEVHAAGGLQIVRWEREVFLQGPAHLICRGDFFL
jgi:diaminopimelate epimerase